MLRNSEWIDLFSFSKSKCSYWKCYANNVICNENVLYEVRYVFTVMVSYLWIPLYVWSHLSSGFRCQTSAVKSSVFKLYAHCSHIEYCVYFPEEVCVMVSVCILLFKCVRSPFQYFYSLRPYGINYKQNMQGGAKATFLWIASALNGRLMPQLLYNKAKTLTEVNEPANRTVLCKSWKSLAKLHGRAGLDKKKKEETFKFTDLMRPQMTNELWSDSWMTERSAESVLFILKIAFKSWSMPFWIKCNLSFVYASTHISM